MTPPRAYVLAICLLTAASALAQPAAPIPPAPPPPVETASIPAETASIPADTASTPADTASTPADTASTPPQSLPPALVWHPPAPDQLRLQEIALLEAEGQHDKEVGSFWMATGGGMIIVGTALLIAGSWEGDHRCVTHPNAPYAKGAGRIERCSDGELSFAGFGTATFGIAALIPGIVQYVGGVDALAEARVLRLGCDCAVSWHPTIGVNGAGITLEIAR